MSKIKADNAVKSKAVADGLIVLIGDRNIINLVKAYEMLIVSCVFLFFTVLKGAGNCGIAEKGIVTAKAATMPFTASGGNRTPDNPAPETGALSTELQMRQQLI